MTPKTNQPKLKLLLVFEVRTGEQIERKQVAKITGEGAQNEGGTEKAAPKGYSLNAPCPCGSGLKYKRCCGKNKQ